MLIRLWKRRRAQKASRLVVEAMEETYRSLEKLAIECGSLDGLQNLTDRFSDLAESRLTSSTAAYLRLGPEPSVLAEQEHQMLELHRRLEDQLQAIRQSGTSRGIWIGAVTILAFVALIGLLLAVAGTTVLPVHLWLLACGATILCLQYFVWFGWSAERKVRTEATRLARMIQSHRVGCLEEGLRRAWLNRWVANRKRELVDLYLLHRTRAERAAELAPNGVPTTDQLPVSAKELEAA